MDNSLDNLLRRIEKGAERARQRRVPQKPLQDAQLCDAVAKFFGAFDPAAEKLYRASLPIVDRNPQESVWFQFGAFALVGLAALTQKRDN